MESMNEGLMLEMLALCLFSTAVDLFLSLHVHLIMNYSATPI